MLWSKIITFSKEFISIVTLIWTIDWKSQLIWHTISTYSVLKFFYILFEKLKILWHIKRSWGYFQVRCYHAILVQQTVRLCVIAISNPLPDGSFYFEKKNLMEISFYSQSISLIWICWKTRDSFTIRRSSVPGKPTEP